MPTAEQNLKQRLAEAQQVFTSALDSLLRRAPMVYTEAVPVHEVARTMRDQGVGSVIVVDQRSRPIGIFTRNDLVRMFAKDLQGTPVSTTMNRDPIALPAHALAYEAALAMVEHRMRHVLITEDGKLAKMISERNLFSLQRLGLAELTMEIRLASNIKLLTRMAAEIRKLTALLVEQGVTAEQLTLFVSVLNDRLSQRMIKVVRKQHR